MNPQETFVTRLRRHRQRNGISLDDIATDTRVKRELLEALERNDLSEWPKGLYARAWIRAYASAVGLDPIDTVDEFCRLFPQGDRRAQATIQEIASIVAEPSGYRDEFQHPEDRRQNRTPEINMLPAPAWHAPVTQAARAFWLRVSAAAAPHLRTRRTPRTST
jgi:transcriptional regulator with XRE-family HTH domain